MRIIRKISAAELCQILFLLLFITIISCNDQDDQGVIQAETSVVDGISNSTFKVWGNCGMCEDKIEASLKVDGVKEADWDSETKIMKVTYDSTVINLDQIHKKIAAVGYDTQKYRSSDSTYSNLHECCQYERKK